jgi:hypothetical protein
MGFWTANNQRYAFNYLRSAGLSPYGAAALVSRWANVESTGAGPAAINPSSGAFGIAQWLGSRLAPIRGNINFDAQLRYAVQELNGSESRAGSVLRSAANAQQGALGASMYERAEGYNSATGADNYISRTASGVAGVLAAAGAIATPQQANQTESGNDTDNTIANDSAPGQSDITPLLLLAAAAVGLYLWTR